MATGETQPTRPLGFRVWNVRRGEYVTHATGGMGWPDFSEIRMTPDGKLIIQEEYGRQELSPEHYRAEML